METNNVSSAIKLIKEEINKLQDEQNVALKSAAYLGMTPAIAKQCDERRLLITSLVQKIMDLQGPAEPTESPQIPDAVSQADTESAEPLES